MHGSALSDPNDDLSDHDTSDAQPHSIAHKLLTN